MEKETTFGNSMGVFREGVFARFMVAEFVSMVGTWMQAQAQQFVIEEHAGSSWEQAVISGVTMLLVPLFSPLGGALADRSDKRRILFVVLGIQSLLALLVGWWLHLGILSFWLLLPVAALLGVSGGFEMPAYSALVPELVPKEKLAAAVAIDRSVFHSARIIGPALAGWLVGWLGTQSAFYANALSYLCPLVVLCTLAPRKVGTAEQEAARRGGFADGLRHVRSDAPTRRMVLLMASCALFCSPFVVVMLTWYGRRTLGLSPGQVGWLMSLSGIGALLASLVLLGIPSRRRVLFLRSGAAISVIAMVGLAGAQFFWQAALCISLLTLGLNFLFGIGNQLVQERAPDEIRGRVSAVAALSVGGVMPFSGFAVSGLEHWLGMRNALLVCAAGYALVSAAMLSRRWPSSEGAGES